MTGIGAPGSAKNSARARPGVKLAALAFVAIAVFAVFELALRLVPAAIPPKLLILFEPGLRAELAAGAFPLQRDFREVPRDDGGPPLFVPKPDSRVVSIDRTADGVERSTDELGFCNPRGRYDARATLDVIALGDSFSWCHAVLPEHAWPAVLEARSGLAVFSLGLGGKGPYEYVQYLRAFGLAKKPRFVVMNIYGGNDLRDAVLWRDYRDAVRRGVEPASGDPKNIAPWLAGSAIGRNSYALNFVLAAVSRLAAVDSGDLAKRGVDFRYRLRLPSGDVPFNVENRDRDEVVSARHLADGSTPLSIWDEALARFAALAREHGFRAIVSFTPPAYAAYADLAQFEDETIAPLMKEYVEAQRRFLAGRAASMGFSFHDLTNDLSAAGAAGDLLYDPVHVHLTVRGNEVVGESIARMIRGL